VVARYALLTLHRPSNVDHRDTFLNILEGLRDFSGSCPVIFPAHPRTLKSIGDLGLAEFFEFGTGTPEQNSLRPISPTRRIRLVDPLGYLDFLCLMKHASLVVTDSGGIQEETTCLGVPCVTVRDNTERPATVTRGTNVIAGTKTESIRKAILEQTSSRRRTGDVPEKWDGRAGVRILEALSLELREKNLASTLSR
jgi:UDP-N-acetylglucosamine 2-epimerase (non-hydrolysing)